MRWCVVAIVLAAQLGAQAPAGKRSRPQQHVSPLETPVATFHGTLTSASKKEVILALPNDQSITFHVSHKTKFLKDSKPVKPEALPAGAAVTIEGKRDLLGNVEAVSVTLDSPAKTPPANAPEQGGAAAPPH